MKQLTNLFLTFVKIGLVSFGGGYSNLPILQYEIVEKKNWVTNEELIDYYAIGQCAPGIIFINVAVFVGRKIKGVLGGITAALGVVFPSLLVITIVATFISNFSDLPIVKSAFVGIRACVCALIANAVIKLWKNSVLDIFTAVIFFGVFISVAFMDVSPVIVVILAAVTGIAVKSRGGKKV
ncbi:MAG: chromate transporter [Eubacteriales bacterium]